MVRTRADAGATRAAGAKAPRKNLGGVSARMVIANAFADKGKGKDHSSGNSYCPRETPDWQKPITSFFQRPSTESGEGSLEWKDKMNESVDAEPAAASATSSPSGLTSTEDNPSD
ncbi:PCNA-associated factor-like [Diprion similis]|uniref:PCNA-associated factor-like n=1 Tax=Diprion similis TaxID=362088 RepID=UPI001EF93E58|nr:PCNA-associated factor-like [Diprion similis]